MQRTPLSMRCAASQRLGEQDFGISGHRETGQVPGQQERQGYRKRTREWPRAGKPSENQSRLKRSGPEPEWPPHPRCRHGLRTWSQPTSAQQGRSVQTLTRAATRRIPNDLEERGPHHAVAAPVRRTLHVSSALALPTGLASRRAGAVLRSQLPVDWVRGGSQRSRGTQLHPVHR